MPAPRRDVALAMRKEQANWDARFAEFLERVMAAAVAGQDPKPFQEEHKRLLAEKPLEKK